MARAAGQHFQRNRTRKCECNAPPSYLSIELKCPQRLDDYQPGGKAGREGLKPCILSARGRSHCIFEGCSWLLVDFEKSRKLLREARPRRVSSSFFLPHFRIFHISLQLSLSCFGSSRLLQTYMYAVSPSYGESFLGLPFPQLLLGCVIHMYSCCQCQD